MSKRRGLHDHGKDVSAYAALVRPQSTRGTLHKTLRLGDALRIGEDTRIRFPRRDDRVVSVDVVFRKAVVRMSLTIGEPMDMAGGIRLTIVEADNQSLRLIIEAPKSLVIELDPEE